MGTEDEGLGEDLSAEMLKGSNLQGRISMGCVWAAAPQGDLGVLLKGRSCWGRVLGSTASPGRLGEAGPLWGCGSIRVMLSIGASVGDGPSGAALPPQFMQKKSPLYVLLKEDTVWSMEHLNRYINDKFHKTRGLPRDWVFTTFTVCVCPAHSVRGRDAGQYWGRGCWATGRSLGGAASGCAHSSWL